MLVRTGTIAIAGIEPIEVDVEVSIYNRGLPGFDIVGLPNKSVDESRLRIKSVFQNLGYKFPERKITVNLAPADIKKEGSFYDLPIAVGIYCCQNKIKPERNSLFFGEISLNGNLRYSKGAFLIGYFAGLKGYDSLFLPYSARKEVSIFNKVSTYPAKDLKEIIDHIEGKKKIIKIGIPAKPPKKTKCKKSVFDSIIGQKFSKRALTISIAGRHNLLMVGPPGSGKSLLARSGRELIGDLTEGESIEVSKIYSSVGKLNKNQLITSPPFRDPHHTISYAGMVGGGSNPKPGEISFAHRGILFLDELTEFSRKVLETLRQPMEYGTIQISRARESFIFPSRFLLLAACNPCPCGHYGDKKVACKCSPKIIERYFHKISGPILDRIDLHVRLSRVEEANLIRYDRKKDADSAYIKDMIVRAIAIQRKRFINRDILYNSEMNNDDISKYCELESESKDLLLDASKKMFLSARSFFKVIKVSRTIADLGGSPNIRVEHLSEALQFKNDFLDR